MKVLSTDLKVNKNELDVLNIESFLNKKGITPLRWAITDISKNDYTISYSYKTNERKES